MSLPRAALVLAITLALSACSSSEPPASGSTTATTATTSAQTASTPSAAPTGAGAGPATGIAACDEFLAAYEQCLVDKIPAQAREQMQTGVAQWRQAWQDMAGNAATRDALPQVCQQAREASRPALQAYGCTL